MKTLTSALFLSMAVLSTGALASQNIEPNNVPFQGVYGQVDASAASRDQVQAELAQSKANGTYTFGESEAYPAVQADRGTAVTREQVRAELAQAKANGTYTFGELDYPPVK
ncbi:hypothetical protein CEG14_17355 [Bordetella genomosp. 1]|uniref:DUF4148 domain-containing protein n=1 Tax=Bordetella genomosp. 1 TaxID=1395607 RepID=A0A261S667_9BORD|nr:DUF4148 domain-containing protein [Bordetella genomosp. 1]MDQ8034208.1 DUF4148 domain-containing protein [Bordetella sp.]OZI32675.1 hypothetical protein CEG14_17355 [Bordetella genomosp. 1]OZI65970.1 hypothetical protein CAL27_13370 [Bordetella genomosp. 1]